MVACNRKCGMCTVLWFGIVLVPLGLFLSLFWGTLYNKILRHEIVLTNTSKSYTLWKETPIPMYLSLYLFNWTNAEEVLAKKWNLKPEFQECGPYVFSEHHIRVNLTWNKNGTVTYQQKRIWHFIPSKSNGSLQDTITNLNPVVTVVGNKLKKFNFAIKLLANFALIHYEKNLINTKTVDELLFTGYNDSILEKLNKLNIPGFNIPFTKFGWFYSRNNSATYDGTYTMYTGKTDTDMLGIMNLWNGHLHTMDYGDDCSLVNGTSGELWPPVKNREWVSIFSSDVCSLLKLQHQGQEVIQDVVGKKFVGTDYMFDNGTKYPEQACFRGDRTVPSGTRDVSKCKFDAPAFVSYPHFYLADSSYLEAVKGLHPNKTEHETYMTVEPNTGVPLEACAQIQINLYIEPISYMSMFNNITPTYIPMLWFRQSATLTEEYASTVQLLVRLSTAGLYAGWSVFGIGMLLAIIGLFVIYRKENKEQDLQHLLEDDQQQKQ